MRHGALYLAAKAEYRLAMKRAVLCLAVLGYLASGVQARAQDLSNVETIGFADGTCSRFKAGPANLSCKALIYTHYRNRRTSFSFAAQDGTVYSMAGGRDSQLTSDRYVLEIDALRVGRGGQTQSYKSTGRCSANISADGRFVHAVDCRVNDGLQSIDVQFRGNGTPMELKHF